VAVEALKQEIQEVAVLLAQQQLEQYQHQQFLIQVPLLQQKALLDTQVEVNQQVQAQMLLLVFQRGAVVRIMVQVET
jgi:hypothetical protein